MTSWLGIGDAIEGLSVLYDVVDTERSTTSYTHKNIDSVVTSDVDGTRGGGTARKRYLADSLEVAAERGPNTIRSHFQLSATALRSRKAQATRG